MAINQYLDVEDYKQRMDNDVELMIELYQIFIEDFNLLMADIGNAIENNDAQALRISAHTLKGSSACISAKVIQEMASELEKMAITNDLSDASSASKRLKVCCEMTVAEIHSVLNQLKKD